MSTAPQYRPLYTVEDFQLWEGDWELWNGTAVSMTPSPFGRHGVLLGRITTAVSNAIENAKCDAHAIVEIDWIISVDTVVRPDLSIVCGDPPTQHVEQAPAIVVEVLSPGTRERDLTFKRQLYAEQSVKWYLIVDPDCSTLHALRLEGGQYNTSPHSETLKVDICDDCELVVSVDRLFR